MSQAKNVVTFDQFRGCDFTNAGTDMDIDKSPNCVNMIRDVPGKIRKRMGYKFSNNYGAQINGYHYLANEKLACIHAGADIYNVGGSQKSAYFANYTGGENSGWLNLTIDPNSPTTNNEEETKTPDAFVAVGSSGYAAGKYDKLVGGNMMTGMRAVCYGAGRFIAVGDSGKAYYSTDKGKNWEKMEGLDAKKNYYGVTYSEYQSMYIAVGTTSIYCCRDGIHWYNAAPKLTLKYTFRDVTGFAKTKGNDFATTHYDNDYAVIVGDGGYCLLRKGAGNDSGDEVEQFALSGNRYCIFADDTKESNDELFIVAGNGILERWKIGHAETGDVQCVRTSYTASNKVYRGGYHQAKSNMLYLIGDGGLLNSFNLSNETVTTLDKPKKENNHLYGIAYNGEYYVIVCNNTNYAYYSKDMKDWTKLKIKYSMQAITAPIKEKKETYYKAKVYFTDYTNIEILPSSVTDISSDKKNLVYNLTDYKSNVRSVVMEYYIKDEVKIYKTSSTTSVELAKSVKSLYSGVKDDISISIPFSNKLYILDGKALLCYDGYSVNAVNDIAYTPKLTISKDPKGGGTDFEAINLIQPGFTEEFYVKTGTTASQFQMTFGELDETEVKAWVKNSNAEWVRKYENTDFTVDRIMGIITFTSAVSAAPVEGEDNVRITAYRTVDGYADRINKCTIACLFGVGGAQDRLFVSGNPDKKYLNYDWYSQQNDATYFGDTSYCTVGNTSSKIVGYAIINNYLAAFKGDGERHQNVVIRQGNLTDSKPSFPLVNTLQGEAAIAPHSFQYLATEPVFLSGSGIMAITSQDITSEKYTQDRSFYLNGKLLSESADDLKNAYSCIYNDMYLLSVNNKLYVLDGIQPMQTDKSLPYATRQYAGFYCTNIPARVMWVDNDNVLCFGTDTGDVFKFYTDKNDIESYTDNGQAIEAVYETPDMGGKVFFKNKTFKFLAIRMGALVQTSVKVYVQRNGLWSLIKDDQNGNLCFSFENLTFSRFSFKTDNTPKQITTKLRVKKVDKMRLRLVNDANKEQFSIYDIGMEYTERGNHK